MLVIVYTSFPVQVYVLQGLHKFLCIGVIPPVNNPITEVVWLCETSNLIIYHYRYSAVF